MVMKIADILSTTYNGCRVQMLFMDGAGIAGPIAQRLRDLGYSNILEINFGAHAPDRKYKLMRSFMWGKMKEWLLAGGGIDKDKNLGEDLAAPGYSLTKLTEVLLEPKDKIRDRIGHSTDGDALALTFAMPVKAKSVSAAIQARNAWQPARPLEGGGGWMT